MKSVIHVQRADRAHVGDPRQRREQHGRVEAAAERPGVTILGTRPVRQRRSKPVEKAALVVAFRRAARRQPSLYTP
jgi:hypothetical protein